MLEPRPIRTETDYRAALNEIERLFDAEPNTPECNRLEVLTTLVEAYEQRHYPIAAPDPIEAILYYLESRGLPWQDLESIIGSRAEVGEVLNRQQALTLFDDSAFAFLIGDSCGGVDSTILSNKKFCLI